MRRSNWACFLLLVTALGCSGGGEGAATVKVTGRVTLDGAPVDGATVTFSPPPGGRSAIGKTDAKGEFTLATTGSMSGVVAGEYRVAVSKERIEGGMTVEQSQAFYEKTGQPPPAPKVMDELPAKYKNPATSGFTAKIEPGKPLELTFEMKK